MDAWTRFKQYFIVDPVSGCWLWTGGTNEKGYGIFWDGKKYVRAHRFSYEFVHGPIPKGMTLDHLCRTRRCVCPEPEHTEPVTNKVNVLRGNGPTAINARRTVCKYGHPFDEENTRRFKDGFRHCHICSIRRSYEWRHQAKFTGFIAEEK